MNEPILEVLNVVRHYERPRRSLFAKKPRIEALKGVSFRVQAGESFGIVGESGSGKTTLAKAILALEEPTSGTIRFKGQNLFTMPVQQRRALRRHVQMVFQDPFGSLDPRQPVREIVTEPLDLLDEIGADEWELRAIETITSVGLQPSDLDKFPHEFSGGQRQRIAIARALITRPDLIVADEPVSALDVSVQAQVLNLMMDLQERYGLTYIIISHDLSVVRHVTDRLAVMEGGRIVEQGDTRDIFENPKHPYTRELLNSVLDLPEGALADDREAEADDPYDAGQEETDADQAGAEPTGADDNDYYDDDDDELYVPAARPNGAPPPARRIGFARPVSPPPPANVEPVREPPSEDAAEDEDQAPAPFAPTTPAAAAISSSPYTLSSGAGMTPAPGFSEAPAMPAPDITEEEDVTEDGDVTEEDDDVAEDEDVTEEDDDVAEDEDITEDDLAAEEDVTAEDEEEEDDQDRDLQIADRITVRSQSDDDVVFPGHDGVGPGAAARAREPKSRARESERIDAQNLIDGRWQDALAGDAIEIVNPSDGLTFGQIARGAEADIDEAVRSAYRTMAGPWGRMPAFERGRILARLAELVLGQVDHLAALEARDVGKPLSQARADAVALARYFEFYGGAADKIHGQTIPYHDGYTVLTLREPHGVTGHIVPWNYPMQIIGRSIGAALAMGNACVLKPGEDASLTALEIGQLALEAGLPPGALNIVTGFGEEAGAALAAHPGVDHLSFTGSVAAGRLVQQAAASHSCPVTLELGGKSPQIVFEDADLEQALPLLVKAAIQNAGQTCSAGSRVLIQDWIYDEVVHRLAERFDALDVGPAERDMDCGPVINPDQQARIERYLRRAKADRIEILGEGEIAPGTPSGGYYVKPTLLGNVDPEHALAQDEIFGPVLAAIRFTNEDDAIRIANNSAYGLVAGVWTKDGGRQMRLARAIKTGQVFINNYGAGGGVELPFGGVKSSGHGREKGFEALYGFSTLKTIAMHHG